MIIFAFSTVCLVSMSIQNYYKEMIFFFFLFRHFFVLSIWAPQRRQVAHLIAVYLVSVSIQNYYTEKIWFLGDFLSFWFDNFWSERLNASRLRTSPNKRPDACVYPKIAPSSYLLICAKMMFMLTRMMFMLMKMVMVLPICLSSPRWCSCWWGFCSCWWRWLWFFLFVYLRQDDVHPDEDGYIEWLCMFCGR